MNNPMTHPTKEQGREDEAVAANIVFQIGDALYDALPPDVAHEHFVTARQKTNDLAIDFTKKLLASVRSSERERVTEEIASAMKTNILRAGDSSNIKDAITEIGSHRDGPAYLGSSYLDLFQSLASPDPLTNEESHE